MQETHARSTLLRTAAAGLALPLALLAAAPAAASGLPPQAASAAASPQAFEPQAAWTLPTADPAELRRRLAALELRVRALGARAALANGETRNGLHLLHRQAAALVPFEGQEELLRDVVLVRARVALDAGDAAGAQRILEQALVPRASAETIEKGQASKAVPEAFRALVQRVAKAPSVKALRLEAASQVSGPAGPRTIPAQEELPASSSTTSDELEQAVTEAIQSGNWNLLAAIGGRAVDPLVAAAQDYGAASLDSPSNDPLYGLFRLDPNLAGVTVLQHLATDDYLMRLRALGVIRHTDILDAYRGSSWKRGAADAEGIVPIEHSAQSWLDVLAWILEEPELVATALDLARPALAMDTLTPRLEAVLMEIVERVPASERGSLFEAYNSAKAGYAATSARLMAVLLRHGSLEEQRRAARLLACLPSSDALMAQADHPDPEVRRWMAWSRFDQRMISRPDGLPSETWVSQKIPVSVDLRPHDRGVVVGLLRDPDSTVRMTALRVCLEHDWLDEAAVAAVLAEPSRDEVLALVQERQGLGNAARVVLLECAFDLAAGGLALDDELRMQLPSVLAAELSNPEPAADRLTARALSGSLHPSQIPMLYAQGLRGRSSGLRLVRVIAGLQPEALAAERAEDLLSLWISGGGLSDAGRYTRLQESLEGEPAALRRLLALALPAHSKQADTLLGDESLHPLLRDLAGDAKLNAKRRLRALAFEGFDTPSLTASVLNSVDWREQGTLPYLSRAVANLLPEDRGRLQDRLLADANANPARVVPCLTNNVEPSDPGFQDRLARTVDYALALWADTSLFKLRDDLERLLRGAASVLRHAPDVATEARLQALFLLGDRGFAQELIEALGTLRDPRHVPLLEAQLESPLTIVRNNSWVPMGILVAETLTGFGTEAAGQALARGLGATRSEVRASCSLGLEELERMLRQRERWERAGLRVPTREEAVAELLNLTASDVPAVRVEAVHALGTAGAVEALPQLVRLVADPVPDVAAAARATLERLRAGPPLGTAAADAPGGPQVPSDR